MARERVGPCTFMGRCVKPRETRFSPVRMGICTIPAMRGGGEKMQHFTPSKIQYLYTQIPQDIGTPKISGVDKTSGTRYGAYTRCRVCIQDMPRDTGRRKCGGDNNTISRIEKNKRVRDIGICEMQWLMDTVDTICSRYIITPICVEIRWLIGGRRAWNTMSHRVYRKGGKTRDTANLKASHRYNMLCWRCDKYTRWSSKGVARLWSSGGYRWPLIVSSRS